LGKKSPHQRWWDRRPKEQKRKGGVVPNKSKESGSVNSAATQVLCPETQVRRKSPRRRRPYKFEKKSGLQKLRKANKSQKKDVSLAECGPRVTNRVQKGKKEEYGQVVNPNSISISREPDRKGCP